MVQPPFMYDAVRSDCSQSTFDPRAISRTSVIPKAAKPKQDGPLVSFNRHPDSYLIVPYGDLNSKSMSPKVKMRIKWSRIVQLILRCFEILISMGLLGLMILIKGIDVAEGWVMRVVPGVAILHTVYAAYHLSRRASGRTPASTASYMLFASFLDVTILAFYAFSALAAKTNRNSWKSVLSNQSLNPTLCLIIYYLAIVGASLFLISLGISAWLAHTFRTITKLPPDCNPLEDNLTSRHKHKTSAVSVATTASNLLPMSLESKRSSGAPYEELGRPPMVPFLHTRSNSSHDSFRTDKSSFHRRDDSQLSYPERHYQIPTDLLRSSISHQQKHNSFGFSSRPSQRDSYSKGPLSETPSPQSSRNMVDLSQGWYTSDSLSHQRSRYPQKKNGQYQAIEIYDPQDEPNLEPDIITEWLSDSGRSSPSKDPHTTTQAIHPLAGNPLTPRRDVLNDSQVSPLSEIDPNRSESDIGNLTRASSTYSRDTYGKPPTKHEEFRAKIYGELKPGTPPLLVGSNRQVSSGNEFGVVPGGRAYKRDVSGKIVEEGRGGHDGRGWTARFRKVSGV